MVYRSFRVVVLAALCPSSLGIECYRARSALPIASHCQDLIGAIDYLSRMPGQDNIRTWGARLPTTPDSMNLPQVYWIGGRGPETCAVHVDVDPLQYFAVDSFTQGSVSLTAAKIQVSCLVKQGLLGLDYPNGAKHVFVKLVRTDAPFALKLLGSYEVRNVSLPNSTDILQVATRDIVSSSERLLVSNGSISPTSQE